MEAYRNSPFSHEKRGFLVLIIGFLLLSFGTSWADSPIYQGPFWDAAPAAAYNSKQGEFLVVSYSFNPLYPPNNVNFFGPVQGQLIKENGNKIGGPFEIMKDGVLPQVAYNPQTNEYLVVAERSYNTVGQRVSALGMKVGGMITYLTNARSPRVLYNSLAGNYLVAGAWWSDTPSCTIQIYTIQATSNGQPTGVPTRVANESYNACLDGALYALEYAPIASTKAPQGRYLLAINRPTNLKMLDSQGQVLKVLYDPAHDTWYENVPFQAWLGTQYNIDIAYGTWAGQPAFFLVWGDPFGHNVPDHGQWTGIWGGIVEAAKELYFTTNSVSNEVFPISYQWNHLTTDQDAYKQWKPVAKYNNAAGTFVAAWRETPLGDPRDLTNVNHIRVNTVSHYAIPPQANLVISSTTGTENPTLPFIGSSTKTSQVLIGWEDHRNFLGIGDIYGTLFDGAARSTSGINPPLPGERPIYWMSVSGGWGDSLAIRSDGSLWAWGNNWRGALGIGNTDEQHSPTSVAPGSIWSHVSAGDSFFTQGIRSDGGLWAWGNNDGGELGIGNTIEQHSPVPVVPGTTWTQVSAGGGHSLGIRSDGSLWAWGSNHAGQLGIGSIIDQHSPVPVASGTTWTQVSGGDYANTLGIRSDGSLWAWGNNYWGQLGIGNTIEQHSPVPVASGTTWTQVSAGFLFALGIRSDGSLWAWGSNAFGQLGIGNADDQHSPVLVAPGTTWTQVSAGTYHTLGIRSDGSLWAWGSNGSGELGIENTEHQQSPVMVGNGMDWVSIAAGGGFSLGLRADGCLYVWGSNYYGQLGLGDTQDRHVPTLIPTSCPALSGAQVLTVSPSGTGSGTVTGNGINCVWNGSGSSGTCSVTLDANTQVSLSAAPSGGSTFTGWIGGSGSATGCSGAGTCAFNITETSWVGAPFIIGEPAGNIFLPLILRN